MEDDLLGWRLKLGSKRVESSSEKPQQNRSTSRNIKMLLAAVLATLGCAALSQAGGQVPPNPLTAPLRFTANGTFQISIFEDLHFGEDYWFDWGPQQDVDTVKVMNEVLDRETPQLVVLNGDLITGENAFADNSTAVINQIAQPMVQRNLTWASTYGNHDSQFNLSRSEILKAEHNYTNSRTKNMLPTEEYGVTNYFLPVYPSDGSDVPSLILWFFDSRGGFKFNQTDPKTGKGVPEPDWVDQRVVDWFIWNSDYLTMTYGKTIPSIAFVHIPVDASLRLQQTPKVNAHYQPGINDDHPLAQQAQGWCSDGVYNGTCSYGGQDVPFMRALATTNRLLGVFSGHDHGDTWCYKWNTALLPSYPVAGNGLNLCFGQHSGYGGYGNWVRGSRQLLINEAQLAASTAANDTLDTWIRLETGDVVGAVQLNSTYGQDYYPATPDTYTS